MTFRATVDAEQCAACGICADECPSAALTVGDDLALVGWAAYMACGVCVSQCPQEAISLLRDPARGSRWRFKSSLKMRQQLGLLPKRPLQI